MNTHELLHTITTGERAEVHEAKKQLERLWQKELRYDPERAREEVNAFWEYMDAFEDIEDNRHKADFVGTLTWPLIALGAELYDIFADVILMYSQHPSGLVRNAAVHTAKHFGSPVTFPVISGGGTDASTGEEQREQWDKNREIFCRTVYRAEELLEVYYEERFARYEYIADLPPSIYKSLQKLLAEALLGTPDAERIYMDWLYGGSGVLIPVPESEQNEFGLPKWMDCAWRRVGCGKDECPICGELRRVRQEQEIFAGETPNIEHVLEDMQDNFEEMVSAMKTDAEEMGIDMSELEDMQQPPAPEEFPLYRRVWEWTRTVHNIEHEAAQNGEFWPMTEASADLLWYSRTLAAKVYRQLCTLWQKERGSDIGEADMAYTAYVITECNTILREALSNAAEISPVYYTALNKAAMDLESIMDAIAAHNLTQTGAGQTADTE